MMNVGNAPGRCEFSQLSSQHAAPAWLVKCNTNVRVSQRLRRPMRPAAAVLDRLKDFGRRSLAAGGAVEDLLAAVQPTQRGLATSPSRRAEIDAAVGLLESLGQGMETTASSKIDATWRLLWTTEKETLFILRYARLFGTEAGEVYQVINTQASSLQNVITFPPEGAFVVQSSLTRAGPQRLDFGFTGASLRLPRRTLQLPPYGRGWFDTVYVDRSIRVARDSRGDTLVVARDGPPRDLSCQ